jgi:hypothetical protein
MKEPAKAKRAHLSQVLSDVAVFFLIRFIAFFYLSLGLAADAASHPVDHQPDASPQSK